MTGARDMILNGFGKSLMEGGTGRRIQLLERREFNEEKNEERTEGGMVYV